MSEVIALITPKVSEEDKCRQLPGKTHSGYCNYCRKFGQILRCDLCTGSSHPSCLDPPLDRTEIPSKWICKCCSMMLKDSHGKSGTKNKKRGKDKNNAASASKSVSMVELSDSGKVSISSSRKMESNKQNLSRNGNKNITITEMIITKENSSVQQQKKNRTTDLDDLTIELIGKPTRLCFFCLKPCTSDGMISCSMCDSNFHLTCLNLPLSELSNKKWMCPFHVLDALTRRPFEEYGNDDEEEEEEYHWKGKLNELREFQNFVDQMTSPQALDKTREVSSENVQTDQTRAYSSGSLHLTKNPEFLRESPSDSTCDIYTQRLLILHAVRNILNAAGDSPEQSDEMEQLLEAAVSLVYKFTSERQSSSVMESENKESSNTRIDSSATGSATDNKKAIDEQHKDLMTIDRDTEQDKDFNNSSSGTGGDNSIIEPQVTKTTEDDQKNCRTSSDTDVDCDNVEDNNNNIDNRAEVSDNREKVSDNREVSDNRDEVSDNRDEVSDNREEVITLKDEVFSTIDSPSSSSSRAQEVNDVTSLKKKPRKQNKRRKKLASVTDESKPASPAPSQCSDQNGYQKWLLNHDDDDDNNVFDRHRFRVQELLRRGQKLGLVLEKGNGSNSSKKNLKAISTDTLEWMHFENEIKRTQNFDLWQSIRFRVFCFFRQWSTIVDEKHKEILKEEIDGMITLHNWKLFAQKALPYTNPYPFFNLPFDMGERWSSGYYSKPVAKVKACLFPLAESETIGYMYRNVLTVGFGKKNDVCLANFGKCRSISERCAIIFYHQQTDTYELINCSNYGTVVDYQRYGFSSAINGSVPATDSAFATHSDHYNSRTNSVPHKIPFDQCRSEMENKFLSDIMDIKDRSGCNKTSHGDGESDEQQLLRLISSVPTVWLDALINDAESSNSTEVVQSLKDADDTSAGFGNYGNVTYEFYVKNDNANVTQETNALGQRKEKFQILISKNGPLTPDVPLDLTFADDKNASARTQSETKLGEKSEFKSMKTNKGDDRNGVTIEDNGNDKPEEDITSKNNNDNARDTEPTLATLCECQFQRFNITGECDGPAQLNHGSYVRFGCIEFVFSIVGKQNSIPQ